MSGMYAHERSRCGVNIKVDCRRELCVRRNHPPKPSISPFFRILSSSALRHLRPFHYFRFLQITTNKSKSGWNFSCLRFTSQHLKRASEGPVEYLQVEQVWVVGMGVFLKKAQDGDKIVCSWFHKSRHYRYRGEVVWMKLGIVACPNWLSCCCC